MNSRRYTVSEVLEQPYPYRSALDVGHGVQIHGQLGPARVSPHRGFVRIPIAPMNERRDRPEGSSINLRNASQCATDRHGVALVATQGMKVYLVRESLVGVDRVEDTLPRSELPDPAFSRRQSLETQPVLEKTNK